MVLEWGYNLREFKKIKLESSANVTHEGIITNNVKVRL